MRIIALRGDNSCGKTSTLLIVYNRLLTNGGISTAWRLAGGDPRDFYDIVNYKGLKIAFLTMGDYSNATVNAIHDYNALAIDVFVLASNIRFIKPIRLIMTFNHNLILKTIAIPVNTANNTQANTIDANSIFSLI